METLLGLGVMIAPVAFIFLFLAALYLGGKIKRES